MEWKNERKFDCHWHEDGLSLTLNSTQLCVGVDVVGVGALDDGVLGVLLLNLLWDWRLDEEQKCIRLNETPKCRSKSTGSAKQSLHCSLNYFIFKSKKFWVIRCPGDQMRKWREKCFKTHEKLMKMYSRSTQW